MNEQKVINRNTLVPIGAALSVFLGCGTLLWGVSKIQSELTGLRVEMANIGSSVGLNTTAVQHLTGASLVNKAEFEHISEAILEVKAKLADIDRRLRTIETGK